MLKGRCEEMFDGIDELMSDMLKASGVSILEAVGGMDSDEGAMLVKSCKLYVQMKEYALEQTEVIDRLKDQMDVVMEMNGRLDEQNQKLLGLADKQIEYLRQIDTSINGLDGKGVKKETSK